jgi:N-acetylmuramate 1-kinase
MKLNDTTANATETEKLAATLSLWAKPGLVINLTGDVGAGKSTFARAFIKSLAKRDDEFDIPSPSFSLVQLYDNTRVPVAHVDLYRLTSPTEVIELDLASLISTNILLIEWPERLNDQLSPNTLKINISGTGENRSFEYVANGEWQNILKRNAAVEDFLSSTKWKNSSRSFFEGDASSRRYEILEGSNQKVLLMDMPQRPDGPAVKNGKPYSAIAHLAENINSVIKVNEQLISHGYSAPKIEASDRDQGLAIIEHLGGKTFGRLMADGDELVEPMQEAVALLADMAQKNWPETISSYDIDAQLIEVDLLVSWFWPYAKGVPAPAEVAIDFQELWREILPLAKPEKPHWVLRDYHSPNLIWIEDRASLKRVGLIDTQDAVLGHGAYDLVSMLQDARVDIEHSFAEDLYQHYEQLRDAQGPFDKVKFRTAYCVLGAQRATKILGIFARLAKRDGKPAYLKHMPRVSRYLNENLKHPALRNLKTWYQTNLPEALKLGQQS